MLELLNDQELDQLIGGAHVTTKKEYCRTLMMILMNSNLDEGAKEGALEGARRAGC